MPKLRHISLYALFLVVAVYSLTAVQLQNFANDPGVGWHLETGDWILEHRTVPFFDPFLQNALDSNGKEIYRPWVSDQWLSDVLLAVLFRLGDFPLVYAFFVAAFLVTFFGVLYWGLCGISGAGLAALGASLIAFKISQLHFILRPVQFSFFFFALLLIFLWKWDRQDLRSDKGSHSSRACLLPALGIFFLFVLWANMHPAFVLGGVCLLLFFLAKVCEGILFSQSHDAAFHPQVIFQAGRFPAVLGFAALLGTLVNPYGFTLHESILGLARSDFFMRYHQEWQPPRMGEFVGGLLQVTIFFTLFVPLVLRKLPPSWTLFQLLSFFLFARFAFDAIRMAPFFAIVAAFPLLAAWRVLGDAMRDVGGMPLRLSKVLAQQGKREFSPRRGVVLLPLTCFLILFFASPFREHPHVAWYSTLHYGPSEERFPYAALQAILHDHAGANTTGIFNPARWGGFITRMGEGRLKPLLDDRNELQGEQWYSRIEKASYQQEEFQSILKEYNPDYVLWPKDSLQFRIFSMWPGLTQIYEDAGVVVWRIEGELNK